MNLAGKHITLLGALTVLAAGCEPGPVAMLSEPSGPSLAPGGAAGAAFATGSGQFTQGGEWRTFSFNGKVLSNGEVRGEFQVNNRAVDAKAHGTVTCLAVDGNQAFVGGIIDNTTAPLPNPGAYFRVIDNGEGNAAAPDQISLRGGVQESDIVHEGGSFCCAAGDTVTGCGKEVKRG